jgi:ribonuclease R
MTDYVPKIRRYFASPEAQPQSVTTLAGLLRVKQSQASPFRAAVEELVERGELHRNAQGQLTKALERPQYLGTLRRTARGQGAITPQDDSLTTLDEPTLFVDTPELGGAFDGDTVRFVLLRRRRSRGQRCAQVVEVVQRARQHYVGEYYEQHQQGYVRLSGNSLEEPVHVGDPGAKGVRPGDQVVLEMLQFPTPGNPAQGVITQVLGPRGQPGVDCLTVIHEFELPDAFSDAVLAEARREAEQYQPGDLTDRVDLTAETIITIDPVDARDFDDAISLSREGNGHWRLGVHIADVSHFVKPGSVLDKEAARRGTSVYLPDRVLPMLPEVISNGLASLQQGQVRYTKSVFIGFTPEGIPTEVEFANTAIRVTQRFAYEEVLPLIQGTDPHATRFPAQVVELLEQLHSLAMTLRRRRLARGALDLSLPETKVDFDSDGRVNGAHLTSHDESHQLIEEFMLAANIAVATKLSTLQWPYLHRVHAPPDERKLKMLGTFVAGLGFEVQPWLGREQIQKLLNQVQGQPMAQAISYMTLRSFKQAEYSPAELGHFALNEPFYCHFTSPIRRYPDLLIHRLFDEVVRHPKKPRWISEAELVRLGEQCSKLERRAESAERELIKIKLLTYLQGRIGWEQPGTITSVGRYGMFCVGALIPADGLVPITKMPGELYDFDDRHHTLTGRRSGRVFRLGDRMQLQVAEVDMQKRQLQWKLIIDPLNGKRPRGREAEFRGRAAANDADATSGPPATDDGAFSGDSGFSGETGSARGQTADGESDRRPIRRRPKPGPPPKKRRRGR